MATVQPGGSAPGAALSKLIVSAEHAHARNTAASRTLVEVIYLSILNLCQVRVDSDRRQRARGGIVKVDCFRGARAREKHRSEQNISRSHLSLHFKPLSSPGRFRSEAARPGRHCQS